MRFFALYRFLPFAIFSHDKYYLFITRQSTDQHIWMTVFVFDFGIIYLQNISIILILNRIIIIFLTSRNLLNLILCILTCLMFPKKKSILITFNHLCCHSIEISVTPSSRLVVSKLKVPSTNQRWALKPIPRKSHRLSSISALTATCLSVEYLKESLFRPRSPRVSSVDVCKIWCTIANWKDFGIGRYASSSCYCFARLQISYYGYEVALYNKFERSPSYF